MRYDRVTPRLCALRRALLWTDDFHGVIGLYIPLWSYTIFLYKTFTRVATGETLSWAILAVTRQENRSAAAGRNSVPVPCPHADVT